MDLNLSDQLIIAAYFILILFTGIKFGLKKNSEDPESDYLLAGRKLTLPLFIATLVATWYGSILGVGEFVYNNGITAWLTLGLPYYIAAILFAFVLSKNIRSNKHRTIPELFKNNYGSIASYLSSIIVLLITIPAAYILMLGVLTETLTGLPLGLSIVLSTIVSFIYIYHGGFKSDVYVNVVQLVFMYLGFALLLYFSFKSFGSFSNNLDQLPSYAFAPLEKNSWQYLIAWYFIAFQTFVDPSFYQRCAAAKNEKTAQKGILLSVLLWILFDMLTLFTGLYALANLNISDPVQTYLVLGDNVLPSIAKGFFFVALLSTVMSTLSSYGFLSAQTIGNDLIKPIESKFNLTFNSKFLTKIGLVITATLGIIIANYIPSIIDIFYITASISIPGLLIPMLISFSKKYVLTASAATTLMLLSCLSSTAWLIISKSELEISKYLINIEPMIFGLFASFLLSLLFVKAKVDKNL